MASFLKGNYPLPEEPEKRTEEKKPPETLTDRFEDSVLAKLGGSICFVQKGGTLLWSGEDNEKTG